MEEKIILVNEKDEPVGEGEKLAVHLAGKLHRCFSIFIFNLKGEMLIQKRAQSKYHSGGLWTNACCSHPRVGEETDAAAKRRLLEEMGFDCPIREIFSFTYKAKLDHGITEHEFDHVFLGTFDGEVKINPEEADDYKWISTEKLSEDIKNNPDKYTYWFRIALEKVLKYKNGKKALV